MLVVLVSAILAGAVVGLSFFSPATFIVITAFSQHSLIFVIFKLSFSSSTKNGPIALSPTNFINVPIASAEDSLTLGSEIGQYLLIFYM